MFPVTNFEFFEKAKIVRKYVFFCVFILTSCQISWKFEPENSKELENIFQKFENVQFSFESCFVNSSTLMSFTFHLHKKADISFVIENNMNVQGKYFYSDKISSVAVISKDKEKQSSQLIREGIFDIKPMNSRIQIRCYLEHQNAKENEDIFNTVKKEIFQVRFPTFIVDGKEYEFEPINFVYNKAKR